MVLHENQNTMVVAFLYVQKHGITIVLHIQNYFSTKNMVLQCYMSKIQWW